jgi:hypothetical protein
LKIFIYLLLIVSCIPKKEKIVEPFSFTKSTLPAVKVVDDTREKILQKIVGKGKKSGTASNEGQTCFYEVVEKPNLGSSKYSLKVWWSGKESITQEFDGEFVKDSGSRIVSLKGDLSSRNLVRQEIEYSNNFDILAARFFLNETEGGECEFKEPKSGEVPDNFDPAGAWGEINGSDQGVLGHYCILKPTLNKCGEYSCRVWKKFTFANNAKLNGFYCTTSPEDDLHEENEITTDCKGWNYLDVVYGSQAGYVCKEI